MTIDAWLQAAIADAERRGLPELKPILETLASATAALRAADFNDRGRTRRLTANARRRPQLMMTIEEFGRRLRARRGDVGAASPKSACGGSRPTTRG